MKKILVCYDKSEDSEKALDMSLELVKDREIELAILFVRSKYDRNFIEGDDLSETDIKNQIKNMMKDTIKKVIRSKVKVEGVILKGDPTWKIIEYCGQNSVDLILIGATGIGSGGKYNLGSIAEKLARYSKIPVLIVR